MSNCFDSLIENLTSFLKIKKPIAERVVEDPDLYKRTMYQVMDVIQGVFFFTGPPPKKLKYGKHRFSLGVSRLS